MAAVNLRKGNHSLPPQVNRALYVRNLPFKISSEDIYDIFGKYGAVRQIRVGTTKETRGTAYVVYEDIYDAKTAVDRLTGFNVAGRYLNVLYYQQTMMSKKVDHKKKEEEIARMQEKYGVSTKYKYRERLHCAYPLLAAAFIRAQFNPTLNKLLDLCMRHL